MAVVLRGAAGTRNRAVDVTDTVERKLAAIRLHASQHPDLAHMEASVRGFLQDNAARHGLPAGRSAEVFHAVGVNTPDTIAGF